MQHFSMSFYCFEMVGNIFNVEIKNVCLMKDHKHLCFK